MTTYSQALKAIEILHDYCDEFERSMKTLKDRYPSKPFTQKEVEDVLTMLDDKERFNNIKPWVDAIAITLAEVSFRKDEL